ncbi:hypothetical protein PI125_g20775 [Phytophthora idaei]|nr:hypothetical protein PI125_g20775 [Phytophthora idaei]KAG3132416.1 hypothetical protein PI126_g19653 [Phytophthora idaei]
MQVVPRRSRWDNLEKLKTRYLQCEQVELLVSEKQKNKTKRNLGRKKAWKNKVEQKQPRPEGKKRARDVGEGCKFCRTRGNVWNNHAADECFRNPSFPNYRPRSDKKPSLGKRPAKDVQ